MPFWDPSWLPHGMLQLGLRLRTSSIRVELETDSDPRVPYKEFKSSLDVAERCLRPMLTGRQVTCHRCVWTAVPSVPASQTWGRLHFTRGERLRRHKCRKWIQAKDVRQKSLPWRSLGQEQAMSNCSWEEPTDLVFWGHSQGQP